MPPAKKSRKTSTRKRAKKAATKKAKAKKKTATPTSSQGKEVFVIDANFFICLKQGGNFKFHLMKFGSFAKQHHLGLALSEQVFHELPWVQGTLADHFRKWVSVRVAPEDAVKTVKDRLVKMGYRVPAQDPDLSLVVVAREAASKYKDAQVYLVSDDFKLSQNVTALKYPIEFLSLGAFILKMHNLARKKDEKSYFKAIRNKIMNYTIEYALSRHGQYNAAKKISWMIEKAVSVAGSGLRFEKGKQGGTQLETLSQDETVKKYLKACQKYITTAKPTARQVRAVKPFLPLLDELREAREDLARSQTLLGEDDAVGAQNALNHGAQRLSETFQLAAATLRGKHAEVFNVLVCTELSKLEFMAAFLLLNDTEGTEEDQARNIDFALSRLDRAAFFSTIAMDTRSVLSLNYTKSVILVFSGQYEKAFRQQDFTINLAKVYGERSLELKCKIGKAIAMYLSGESESAGAFMELVSQMMGEAEEEKVNVENLRDAQLVLNEIGDYFYTLDRPEIALALYDESLECAVDAGLDYRVKALVEKIKRSTLAAAYRGYSGDTNIDSIIDRAYEVKDVDKYNEVIAKISEIHTLFYEDFPYFTKKGQWMDYFELPEPLLEEMELIEIKKLAKGTLFVAYSEELGLIGFIPPGKDLTHGIPENYTIKLTKKAQVKVQKLSAELKSKYLIRAVVRLKKTEGMEIIRHVPRFFASLQV